MFCYHSFCEIVVVSPHKISEINDLGPGEASKVIFADENYCFVFELFSTRDKDIWEEIPPEIVGKGKE